MGSDAARSWPPFEPGNEVALVHGARSPRHLEPIARAVVVELERVAPWTSAPVFDATVQAWAWAEATCVLYRRHFDGTGVHPRDDAGAARWDRAERRAARLRVELGLTPAALTSLLAKLAGLVEPAAAQSALDQLRAAGRDIQAAAAAGALGDGERKAE